VRQGDLTEIWSLRQPPTFRTVSEPKRFVSLNVSIEPVELVELAPTLLAAA
jgi:hypothetical protein